MCYAHFRCHSCTYPCLHNSPTRLLQLTLCWPPSWQLQCLDLVLRSATRLSGHIHKFGLVSSYMIDVLHWLPLQQRISYRTYNFFSQAVSPGPCSGLSSRPLLHYHGYSGSSLSPLYWVWFSYRPFCPQNNYKQNRAFSVVGPSLWNGLSLALRLYPRILPNSF